MPLFNFFFNPLCEKCIHMIHIYFINDFLVNFVRYKYVFLSHHVDFCLYIYIRIYYWPGQEKGWFDKLCFFIYNFFFVEFFMDFNVSCAKEWMAGKRRIVKIFIAIIHFYFASLFVLCSALYFLYTV